MDMIIATHNKHKVEEFSRILAPLGVTIRTAALTEAEETGTTFRENAYLKAKSACDETGLPCIADDSGPLHERDLLRVPERRRAGGRRALLRQHRA